ncbi:MAG: hypothetical protein WAL91_09825, partial [Propionicimonas sp.]
MSKLHGRENPDRRLMLCADAFHFSGVVFMLTEGLTGVVVALTGAEATIPDWLQSAGVILMVGSLVAGVAASWLLHGRAWRARTWIGLLLGMVAGALAMILTIMAIGSFAPFIPNPLPDEGPWGLVIVTVVAVVAFLAVPLIDAVRDLAPGRRARIRIDILRLGSFAVITALVVITVTVGVWENSELGEAGLFMVLVAGPAAAA